MLRARSRPDGRGLTIWVVEEHDGTGWYEAAQCATREHAELFAKSRLLLASCRDLMDDITPSPEKCEEQEFNDTNQICAVVTWGIIRRMRSRVLSLGDV